VVKDKQFLTLPRVGLRETIETVDVWEGSEQVFDKFQILWS